MTFRRLVFMCLMIVLLKATSEAQSSTFNSVDSLLLEAKSSQQTDVLRSKELALKAYSDALKLEYLSGIADASMRLGSVYNWLSKNDSAAHFLRQAVHFRTDLKNFEGASNALAELAIVMSETSRQDSAIHFAIEAEKMANKSGDQKTICNRKIDLANQLMAYGNYAEARSLFENVLKLSRQNPEMLYQKALALDGLAYYHTTFGNDSMAISLLHQIAGIYKALKFDFDLGQIHSNLCLAYHRIGKNEEAIIYGDSALQVFDRLGAEHEVCAMMMNQALAYSALGDKGKAIFNAKRALDISIDLKDLDLEINARQVLSDVFEEANMPDSALKQQRLIAPLRDSLFTAEKIRSVSKMQTKYETEKKDQEILFLDEQNKAKTSQRNFLVAASGALLIALLFLGVIYYNRLRLNRKNQELAQERISGLIKEQEAKTYNALLEGQEEERQRIGTELHDRLGGLLSTTKLMFNSLEDKIAAVSDQQSQNFDKLNLMLDEAVTEVRRVSHDLHSGVVSGFGLVTAVQQQLDNIDQNSEIACKLNAFGMNERLPNAIELNVYRMIQEVLNNILKHANATKISVQITRTDTELNVMIEDDGVGFDVKSLEVKSGIGLKNLVMRAEKLGGTYHIDSQIGRGATSIIEIPLNNEHD